MERIKAPPPVLTEKTMLDIALKEWACVCGMLAAGEFALVLRKGGILEDDGPGGFRLEHERFAMFPSWLHQRPHLLKPEFADRATDHGSEPGELTVTCFAQAARIWEVPSREAFDRLDALHPYASEQIDMRFNYRPERPLYLVALRAHRLPEPCVIANRTSYGGCRSWVPLEAGDHVPTDGATPAMSDARFSEIIERVDQAFG